MKSAYVDIKAKASTSRKPPRPLNCQKFLTPSIGGGKLNLMRPEPHSRSKALLNLPPEMKVFQTFEKLHSDQKKCSMTALKFIERV